ncbi:hypothetical protein HV319_10335 [Citrobacter freundii]|uniref:Uncharacterized protein n=1 Tax=Citrobacter freundii TaxID=546 RepID=A0A9P3Z664_CITFR|nr:hypothetical protein [Citrobacter freundii]EDQ3254005.1 hypothetical protein [Salmonella enterica subsp. enterica serovar Farmsen]QLR91884.1 hypothetical protein HV330_10335 [Citrobacter freundii]QLS39665.1 hypothetical protein HV319_10335 [Citrobacter freundii]HBH7042014.1 hypothetical protein [Citrobacter freundii]HCL6004968.1 hypothetical protein [Citrobacter freundii]
MKNELINVWYRVTFMVTKGNDRYEYSIFTEGNSETGAAVSAAVGICEGSGGLSNPTFKSIRIATYGEAESLDAELDAIAEREQKEQKEEGDE